VTLDLYGHLFPDDMDRLARQLDAAHEAVAEQIAASVRPADSAAILQLPVGRKKRPVTSTFGSGAGWTRTSDRRIMSPLAVLT
jgi:hypothetical protein